MADLVVDTCVLRASNADADDYLHWLLEQEPADLVVPEACSLLLYTIEHRGHNIALSVEINNEYENTMLSRFGSKWLAKMINIGRTSDFGDVRDEGFRTRLLASSASQDTRDIMEKDVHLVEASISGDEIVLSVETRCRREFWSAAATIVELESIMWVSPCISNEDGILWIEHGAQRESEREFGYQRTRNFKPWESVTH